MFGSAIHIQAGLTPTYTRKCQFCRRRFRPMGGNLFVKRGHQELGAQCDDIRAQGHKA
jgi:hypothetical protein